MSFRAIARFFSAPVYQQESHAAYVKIVEAARQQQFYIQYGVPDTVDGRFDMITLQMFLFLDRLRKEHTDPALEFLRAVSEVFFADMDRSLREMGSTDTGTGKRMKKMSQAFYGRLLAYQTAGDDVAKMEEALLRNLYRGDAEKAAQAHRMNDYVQAQRDAYAKLSFEQILNAVIPA